MIEHTKSKLRALFAEVDRLSVQGDKAKYIPSLAQSPDTFNATVLTVQGEELGLHEEGACVDFSIQSIMKPALYGYVLQKLGVKKAHAFVGFEPSGKDFNKLSLDSAGLPHNPLINSGAIMMCALVRYYYKGKSRASVFQELHRFFEALCGGAVHVDHCVYLSEKEHANRNRCLAYMMKERSVMPGDVEDVLDLYFSLCSLVVNTRLLANYACTLANNGTSPKSKEALFSPAVCEKVQAQMLMSGLYNLSGQFCFSVSLPCKSGVSGGLIAVVNGQYGLCCYHPRLGPEGNSFKSVQFVTRLAATFSLGVFCKDANIFEAVHGGDVALVARLLENGASVNAVDYDRRSLLHLAKDNEDEPMQRLLVDSGAVKLTDKFGNTNQPGQSA